VDNYQHIKISVVMRAEAAVATFWSNAAFKLPQTSSGTVPWRQEVHRRHIMLMNDLARLNLEGDAELERTFLIEKRGRPPDRGVASRA
jgi:hypothetical protein